MRMFPSLGVTIPRTPLTETGLLVSVWPIITEFLKVVKSFV